MPDQDSPSYVIIFDSVKNAPLKVIFLVHFILATWGIQGYWSPDSYLFYNLLFFITLFWSIHSKESEEPILLCFLINLISILFDVIVLSAHFPSINYGSSERFSVGMAILNLVFRPASCILIHKCFIERATSTDSARPFGVSNSSRQQRGYQEPDNFSVPESSIPYH